MLSAGFCAEDARAEDARPADAVDHGLVSQEDWDKSCVYELTPVAPRTELGDPNAGGSVGRQITLTGQAEWELAAARSDLTLTPGDMSKLEWTRVKLPNTVQHALFQAGKTSNPWYADNYKSLQWIQKQDWYLRKTFRVPEGWRGRHIRLRFDGLDYVGVVWLDGKLLGIHEGMAGGPTFDITDRVKAGREHELLVRLVHESHPAPLGTFASLLYDDNNPVIKSLAVDGQTYQWGNRFRSIGIWQPVRLVATGQAYLEAPLVRTDAITASGAELWAQAMITNTGPAVEGTVLARIVDLQTGQPVWQEESQQTITNDKSYWGVSYWERRIVLSKPKLWWPNGLGGQPLYRLELSLRIEGRELDAIATRFGVRKLELRRNPAPADSPRSYGVVSSMSFDPLDRQLMLRADESYRFLFVVNGRPFYAKGACWVTSDDLLALTPEREAWLMEAARASHINLFRLNGACNIFETEQFYNLCDEKGILVWQDLPLCFVCGHSAKGRSASRDVWHDQLSQTVLRLRQHPSLAIYVGGNEYRPYTPENLWILGLAREIFASCDDRPFRMASPGGGTRHAYGEGLYPFDDFYGGDPNWYEKQYHRGCNFVSEWSCPALGNMSLLKRVVPAEELARGPVGLDWQKFIKSRPILADRASELEFIGKYPFIRGSWYGDLAKASVGDLVEYGQMAQAKVYGCAMEQWRAHFPYKGGQTVWNYNIMSPVSSWNLIDWFGQPTIAFYAAKRAHEPTHVMARTNFYSWGPGDTFRAAVFAVHDAPEGLKDARITARLLDQQLKPLLHETWTVNVPGGGLKSDDHPLAWSIPTDAPEHYFFLELTLSDSANRPVSRQAYPLRVLKSLADPEKRRKWQSQPVMETLCTSGPWLRPQLASAPTKLDARVVSSRQLSTREAELTIEVRNVGRLPAYPVRVSVVPDEYSTVWGDNYFWLAEGETKMVTGTVRLDMEGLDPVHKPPRAAISDLTVRVSAWNAGETALKP